jgi:hypothetical protein
MRSEVTFVGRHVHEGRTYQGEKSNARYPWDNYGEQPTWLSLAEAAARARVPVDEIKRAIREDGLRSERRGWVQIHNGDLMDWLHRL